MPFHDLRKSRAPIKTVRVHPLLSRRSSRQPPAERLIRRSVVLASLRCDLGRLRDEMSLKCVKGQIQAELELIAVVPSGFLTDFQYPLRFAGTYLPRVREVQATPFSAPRRS